MNNTASAAGDDDVVIAVKTCLISVLGAHVRADLLEDDTNLFDLGIDSMNMTDLLLQLEGRLRFTLEPEDLDHGLFERLGNLVAFVRSRVSRG